MARRRAARAATTGDRLTVQWRLRVWATWTMFRVLVLSNGANHCRHERDGTRLCWVCAAEFY
jgi:hypothetical protein